MKEVPSRPAVRFWPQTTASCCREKAMVVSVAVNVGMISRRVRLREASASEPQMNCRKRIRRCQNRGVTLPPGSARGNPEACPSGIRHVGGAKLNQALVRNVRTCPPASSTGPRFVAIRALSEPQDCAASSRPLSSPVLCRSRDGRESRPGADPHGRDQPAPHPAATARLSPFARSPRRARRRRWQRT